MWRHIKLAPSTPSCRVIRHVLFKCLRSTSKPGGESVRTSGSTQHTPRRVVLSVLNSVDAMISRRPFPFHHFIFRHKNEHTLKNNGFSLRLSYQFNSFVVVAGMVRIIEFELRCHSAAEFVNTRCYCFDNSIRTGNGNIADVLDSGETVDRRSEILAEKNVN